MPAAVEAAPVTVPTIASVKVSVACIFRFVAAAIRQARGTPLLGKIISLVMAHHPRHVGEVRQTTWSMHST